MHIPYDPLSGLQDLDWVLPEAGPLSLYQVLGDGRKGALAGVGGAL